MWGLEYALLFGVPNNKLELSDGRSRLAFPFLTRETAAAHFDAWTETLCRWKGVSERPAVTQGKLGSRIEAAGFVMELAPRPIEMRVPLDDNAFLAFHGSFWRRDLWEGQPAGLESGRGSSLAHGDVTLRLWSLFADLSATHGGHHARRVGLVLSDTAAVEPDLQYFRKPAAECMIGDEYFKGTPDLIAEVLSPATRLIDRGPRRELYRRSGVPHYWLLDPELETIDVYELTRGDYRHRATHRAGDSFRPELFPSETVRVDQLFDTQEKRHGRRLVPETPEPVPEWLVAPDVRLGLEYLFLLGHPELRYEIWGNRAPCVLAFGSPAEAEARFRHFLDEAARWERSAVPAPSRLADDVEQAEVGRFRLTRQVRRVSLDVAVDGRKYRQLLEVCARREAWDWGEE